MNCSLIRTTNGELINAEAIEDYTVEKIKDAYHGIVCYTRIGRKYVLSEGWNTKEAALECLTELVNFLCESINGPGYGAVVKLGGPDSLCPKTWAKGEIKDASEVVNSKMSDLYDNDLLDAYNKSVSDVNNKISNIF